MVKTQTQSRDDFSVDPIEAAQKLTDPPVMPTPISRLNQDAALHFGRLKEARSTRRRWWADIPAGTAFETILQPDYWRHQVRAGIKPLDLIEALCEDGTWEALLRVMFVGRVEVQLSKIYYVEHKEADEAVDSDDYEVHWKGPVLKWVVRNKSNGAVIKDRLFPKTEALTFLRNHLRKA